MDEIMILKFAMQIYSRYGSANMFWCDMQNLSGSKHC